MGNSADLVFLNGQVITVDKNNTVANALVVSGNHIAYVGDNDTAQKYIDLETRVIDLKGKSLLPGFIDAHMHIADIAANTISLDCSFAKATSISEILGLIREASLTTEPGQWIRGYGYDHNNLLEKRHLYRWELDAVTLDHPVVIVRTCGHISCNNSHALDRYGITNANKSYSEDEVELINGIPNGVLKESAFLDSVAHFAVSEAELVGAMKCASDYLSSMGITSIHDAGAFGAMQMKAVQQAISAGHLKTRVYAMMFAYASNDVYIQNVLATGLRTGYGNDRLKIGAMKVAMVDGASSGPTSATKEPYDSDPNNSGILCVTQEKLDALCADAHLNGFQVTAHATGDKAVEMYLNAIEKALKLRPDISHRHRVEHGFLMNPELIGRIKALKVIPIPQPVFYHDFGDGYLVHYGEHRMRYSFPCRSYVDEGIIAAASSDCPVTTANPVFGLHMAVTRMTKKGVVIAPEERISLMDAIRMYTINGAFASFEENIKGSLESGKLADLVVLSEALLTLETPDIQAAKVAMTVIDGEIVYENWRDN